ncbi:MAG: methionine adenosyltransferase [Alphaproteobacteria bacterium]|nr:MAG: methionine adenosyltransferase [Alphaproteobacteria bacterium]
MIFARSLAKKLLPANETALNDFVFTSESVSEGHPDKICDRISDAILDAFMQADPQSRTGIETLATTNRVILAGEVRGPASINNADVMTHIARETVRKIGYDQEGFHWQRMDVHCYIHSQSTDIAQGVDAGGGKDEGAGDQGIMFGYACNETDDLMPAPIYYAHKILRTLSEARHSGQLADLRPDAKSQVSLQYKNGQPTGSTCVVVSTQHKDGLPTHAVREMVRPIVQSVLPEGWMCDDKDFYVNPTGRFVIGGPDGDAGLTGRKIIVDTYGGAAPHGGGAFSGKDPTKVDRSAAYAARYMAKNVVAAGLADKCLIQLSYAIGVSHPLSVYINTFGTGQVDEVKLEKTLRELVNLTPRGIRTHLQLNRPIYERTASYGHFGRDPERDGGFSWEKTDLVDQLKRAF